jgi:hypothetical protein
VGLPWAGGNNTLGAGARIAACGLMALECRPILDQDLGLAQQSDDLLRRVFLPWQFLAPRKLEIVGSPTLKVGKLQAEEYVRDRK